MQVAVKEPSVKEFLVNLKTGEEFTTTVWGRTFTLKVIDVEED